MNLTDTEVTAIMTLIRIASCAEDVTEFTSFEGSGYLTDVCSMDRLSDELDALGSLPDDRPDYTMSPAAKARWALRRILGDLGAPTWKEAP